jgi:hypothetical protein
MAWRVLLQTLLRQNLNHDQTRPGLMRAMGHPRVCVLTVRNGDSLLQKSQMGLILIKKTKTKHEFFEKYL